MPWLGILEAPLRGLGTILTGRMKPGWLSLQTQDAHDLPLSQNYQQTQFLGWRCPRL